MELKNLLLMRRIVNDICLDGVCDSVSIDDLNNLRVNLQIAIEKQDLKDFLIHVENAMPVADDEESWDAFYNKPFRISFDGKSIKLPMDATVYQNITNLLEEFIEDQYLDGRNFTKTRKMYCCMLGIKTNLNRINEAIKDEHNFDNDAYYLAIHDIKDIMSKNIDELLEILKS